MPTYANKFGLEHAVREAAKKLLEEHDLWENISTTGKLNFAMQMALRWNLDSDHGQVAPEVTTAIMTVAEKYNDEIVRQAIDRAWEAYSLGDS